MAYVASPEEKAQYLRRVQNAAAGAFGCENISLEEIQEAFNAGIAEIRAQQARIAEADARASMSSPAYQGDGPGTTSALAAFTASFR